jgi:hypothetical protein
MLMLHGVAFSRNESGAAHEEDIAIPPAFLVDTTTSTVMAAIHHRAGALMKATQASVDPARASQHCAIILNSDSARAMVKLAKTYAKAARNEGPLFVHARCQMHMFWASLSAAMQPFNILSPMFCGCTLLRKGANKQTLRKLVHKHIRRNLQVSYVAPSVASVPFNTTLVNMLNAAERVTHDVPDSDDSGLAGRRAARQELLKLLPWSWDDCSNLKHYCSLRCIPPCSPKGQPGDAADKVCDALDKGFLNCLPCIPALNRWNKVYGPLAWFTFCQGFFGIVLNAIMEMHESLQSATTAELARVVSVDELISLSDTYRAITAMRWRKLSAFLSKPLTQLALPVLSVMFGVASKTLGTFFREARMMSHGSVKPFLHPSTSPAEKLLLDLARLLAEADSPEWQAADISIDSSLRVAYVSMLLLMGNVFLRCVSNFNVWPWPLMRLAHEATTEGEQAQIAEQFMRVKECCTPHHDGLTLPLRRRTETLGDVRATGNIAFLQDILLRTPASNILTEDRFARVRRHAESNSGRAVAPSTVAAHHLLSEFSAMFESAEQAWRQVLRYCNLP